MFLGIKAHISERKLGLLAFSGTFVKSHACLFGRMCGFCGARVEKTVQGNVVRVRGLGHGAHEFAKLVFEISIVSWTHARGMARSAHEFAKLIFEISLGSWKRAGYGRFYEKSKNHQKVN